MSDQLARIRAVLGAAVTWLVLAATVAGIIVDELGGIADVPPVVVRVLVAVITVATIAVAIIRRVTPVLDTARGVLPPPTGQPITPAEAELAAELAKVRADRDLYP